MSTTAQLIFAALCRGEGLPEPVAEFRFHPERRWRFDYAWPAHKIALEVEGGVWMAKGGNGKAGHSYGRGKERDHEKFTAAAILGWRVLYCQPRQLNNADTFGNIRAALADGRATR